MTNSNEDFNPVYNNPLPPEFAHWSLDLYLDDDEFRAGYPFSDIPEIESNKTGETYNTSPTLNNDVVQSSNSSGGICISTTKENNQLTELSTEQQEKKADGRLESCLMDERHKNHAIHSGQLNNYKKEVLGDDHQHDIKDSVNAINIETFEASHHVQTNK
ncbi:unnamed protein product [Rotaria sp. Silwood1]|nr:unnamed protein product [Rotaria sp. Silwood1]CAF1263223.1 unnamed protein product [Rotaria sp. Silwood1]CAF3422175.1 unnamed protein product [Rotaria sp. Silwood1]CAF3472887.1 unnamed protein product [Rotaria sp. Silwood1]CAF3472914.1 unnamed protein product [Rotaria sp. Silwood1]